MLAIGPARRRRTGRGKLAIALAGGGPLGAFYALGALHALSEHQLIDDLQITPPTDTHDFNFLA